MSFALAFKLFADGVKFTNIHGWDLEGSGKLYEVALARAQIGTAIVHLVLINQSFWNKEYRSLVINIIMLVLVVALHLFSKKYRKTRLRAILQIIDRIPFGVPSIRDQANWVYRYSHPYFRAKGPKETFRLMNGLNSPINLDPKMFSKVKEKRFNLPFPIERSPSGKFGQLLHAYQVEEGPLNGMESPRQDLKINIAQDPETSSIQQNINLQPLKSGSASRNRIGLPGPIMSSLINSEVHPLSNRHRQSEHDVNAEESKSLLGSRHFRKDSIDLDAIEDNSQDDDDIDEPSREWPRISRIEHPSRNSRMIPGNHGDMNEMELNAGDIADERSNRGSPLDSMSGPGARMATLDNHCTNAPGISIDRTRNSKSDINLIRLPMAEDKLPTGASPPIYRSKVESKPAPMLNQEDIEIGLDGEQGMSSGVMQRQKTRLPTSNYESHTKSSFANPPTSKPKSKAGPSDEEVLLPGASKTVADKHPNGLSNR